MTAERSHNGGAAAAQNLAVASGGKTAASSSDSRSQEQAGGRTEAHSSDGPPLTFCDRCSESFDLDEGGRIDEAGTWCEPCHDANEYDSAWSCGVVLGYKPRRAFNSKLCAVDGCAEPRSFKHEKSKLVYCANHAPDVDLPCKFSDIHYPDERFDADCGCDEHAPTADQLARNKADRQIDEMKGGDS